MSMGYLYHSEDQYTKALGKVFGVAITVASCYILTRHSKQRLFLSLVVLERERQLA